MKLDLKKRNEEVFGNVEKWKKALLVELHDFDIIAKERSLLVEQNARKVEIISELEMTAFLEEVSWRQNSRSLWLREGDKNISFSTIWQTQIEQTTLWIP